MNDARAAQRFAEAAKSFDDDDFLWRLARRDGHGLRRLRESVQLGDASTAVTMLQALMHPRWSEPSFVPALRTCVCELWAVPYLVERLTAAVLDGVVHESAELKVLTDFGVAVAVATPGQHGPDGALSSLAAALVERSTAAGSEATRRRAERLRVLVDGHHAGADPAGGVDEEQPGGRHSNDHADFRRISVLPTTDEVFATTPPFLPRASPDEAFLREDTEAQLLDRNFRLLREDFLAPLRESLTPGELTQHYSVQASGIELHERVDDTELGRRRRIGSGAAGVRLRLHPRHSANSVKELMESGRLRKGSLCLLKRPSQQVPPWLWRGFKPT